MQTFFHNLRQRMTQDGFTVAEIAVVLPLIVLFSSTVIYLMNYSIVTVNNNNLALEASQSVEDVLNTSSEATTCQALENVSSSDGIGNTVHYAGDRDEYTVSTTVEFEDNPLEAMNLPYMEPWEGCNNNGGIATVSSVATKTGDDENPVLYRSTRTVMLDGGIARS